MREEYDIIVVGAGHAGCEAAYAAGSMGAKVLLITMDMTKMGQMSCNPAMGGIAKGQIIREIDALGGMSGIITDKSMVQFRMLNRSKGPAVWSPRAQCDRMLFSGEWRKAIEENENIHLWQDAVTGILYEGSSIRGVVTRMQVKFTAVCVILTVGTFENGLIHIGSVKMEGGRISESKSTGLTAQLKELGILSGRLKTGTPARIDGRTIAFEKLEIQEGDPDIRRFSFNRTDIPKAQLPCFITYTNEEVHNELRKGFEESPLYNGSIQGIGPRYCPSIEDKIVTFAQRERHQLFLEPEGWNTKECYINGFSSSLPLEVQYNALRKITGLEDCRIFRPGYAIEYDYYFPTQLKHSLESKYIDGLFMAGQINGTTGYEEAAAQGLMAGINAAQKIKGLDPLVLARDEGYIGVLIDDLVTKGVDEPYRMFTSRAEYRILLRQDNADDRLSQKGIDLGLLQGERKNLYYVKMKERKQIQEQIHTKSISVEQANQILREKKATELKQKTRIKDLLVRPEISIQDVLGKQLLDIDEKITKKFYFTELLESIEIDIKYAGYIEREKILSEKVKRLEGIRIDHGIDFSALYSISTEGRQKLTRYKPQTIGQASRISGISPSDIHVLLLYLGR